MSPLNFNTTWLQSSLKHFFSHVWTFFEYLLNKVIQPLIPVYLSVFLIDVSLFKMFTQIHIRYTKSLRPSRSSPCISYLGLPCLHVPIISKQRSSSFILLLRKLSTSCIHRTKSVGKSNSYTICAKKIISPESSPRKLYLKFYFDLLCFTGRTHKILKSDYKKNCAHTKVLKVSTKKCPHTKVLTKIKKMCAHTKV